MKVLPNTQITSDLKGILSILHLCSRYTERIASPFPLYLGTPAQFCPAIGPYASLLDIFRTAVEENVIYFCNKDIPLGTINVSYTPCLEREKADAI